MLCDSAEDAPVQWPNAKSRTAAPIMLWKVPPDFQRANLTSATTASGVYPRSSRVLVLGGKRKTGRREVEGGGYRKPWGGGEGALWGAEHARNDGLGEKKVLTETGGHLGLQLDSRRMGSQRGSSIHRGGGTSMFFAGTMALGRRGLRYPAQVRRCLNAEDGGAEVRSLGGSRGFHWPDRGGRRRGWAESLTRETMMTIRAAWW